MDGFPAVSPRVSRVFLKIGVFLLWLVCETFCWEGTDPNMIKQFIVIYPIRILGSQYSPGIFGGSLKNRSPASHTGYIQLTPSFLEGPSSLAESYNGFQKKTGPSAILGGLRTFVFSLNLDNGMIPPIHPKRSPSLSINVLDLRLFDAWKKSEKKY